MTSEIHTNREPSPLFDLENATQSVLAQIREMQASGEIDPELYYFGALHDQMDANVGWGDALDAIEPRDWITVGNRVTVLLSDALGLCTGSAWRGDTANCATCGHNVARDQYGHATAHTPDGKPALTTEPLAVGDRVAYMGDPRGAGRIVDVITTDGQGYEYDEPRYTVRCEDASLHDEGVYTADVYYRRELRRIR